MQMLLLAFPHDGETEAGSLSHLPGLKARKKQSQFGWTPRCYTLP